MTLIQIMTGNLNYDSSWAVYAEKIDGVFQEDSEARFGQIQFENGGLLDGCEFFATNAQIIDSIEAWAEGDPGSVVEGAEQMIEEVNESIH